MRGNRPPFCVDTILEKVKAGGIRDREVTRALRSPAIALGQIFERDPDEWRGGASTNYVVGPGNSVSYSGDSLTTG